MQKIVVLEDQAEQALRLQQMLEKYASCHTDFTYSFRRERAIPLLTEYKCDADVLFLGHSGAGHVRYGGRETSAQWTRRSSLSLSPC